MTVIRFVVLLACASAALTGCASLRDNPGAGCTGDAECGAGRTCYRGFCLAGGLDAALPPDANVPPDDAWSPDAGPDAGETCPGAGVDCTFPMPGRCSTGVTVCRPSGGVRCARATDPALETCNRMDDDCDGATDEDADIPCFTEEPVGCSFDDVAGVFDCAGVCRAGTQYCVDGAPAAACVGEVLPSAGPDGCTAADAVAVDDDCDGALDEDCACTAGETTPCYSGPLGALGVGACAAGTSACESGRFGACVGERLPTAETCGNPGVDDDCNGVVDDVPGTGAPCDTELLGTCADGVTGCMEGGAIGCVAPPERDEQCDIADDDCDGSVDETFDLDTDEAHCGGCGLDCGPGRTCCGGDCLSTAADAMNCGGCGVVCGGATSACCGGRCVAPTAPECTGCPTDCAAAGQACCDLTCVDGATDPAHCGASPGGGCGVACAAGQRCCGGSCVGDSDLHCGGCGPCAGDQQCCGATGAAACVADRDPTNCNACGVRCGSGTTCCASGCVNTQRDELNCGMCGRMCAAGQACSDGRCCGAGLTNCGTSCVNLQNDRANCGVCGRSCVLGCSSGACVVL